MTPASNTDNAIDLAAASLALQRPASTPQHPHKIFKNDSFTLLPVEQCFLLFGSARTRLCTQKQHESTPWQAVSAPQRPVCWRDGAKCCFRLLTRRQIPFFFSFFANNDGETARMERRHGWRDGIQTAAHTARATEVIHQMGYLFWRLVLVKLVPAAQLLHVYLLHLQVDGWMVDSGPSGRLWLL